MQDILPLQMFVNSREGLGSRCPLKVQMTRSFSRVEVRTTGRDSFRAFSVKQGK